MITKNISQAIANHGNVARQGLRNQWKELILGAAFTADGTIFIRLRLCYYDVS